MLNDIRRVIHVIDYRRVVSFIRLREEVLEIQRITVVELMFQSKRYNPGPRLLLGFQTKKTHVKVFVENWTSVRSISMFNGRDV